MLQRGSPLIYPCGAPTNEGGGYVYTYVPTQPIHSSYIINQSLILKFIIKLSFSYFSH